MEGPQATCWNVCGGVWRAPTNIGRAPAPLGERFTGRVLRGYYLHVERAAVCLLRATGASLRYPFATFPARHQYVPSNRLDLHVSPLRS